jgi:hypothetical protein
LLIQFHRDTQPVMAGTSNGGQIELMHRSTYVMVVASCSKAQKKIDNFRDLFNHFQSFQTNSNQSIVGLLQNVCRSSVSLLAPTRSFWILCTVHLHFGNITPRSICMPAPSDSHHKRKHDQDNDQSIQFRSASVATTTGQTSDHSTCSSAAEKTLIEPTLEGTNPSKPVYSGDPWKRLDCLRCCVVLKSLD